METYIHQRVHVLYYSRYGSVHGCMVSQLRKLTHAKDMIHLKFLTNMKLILFLRNFVKIINAFSEK